MTAEQISQVYVELERLEIKLEQTPELGTDYLTGKLLECRQKQNTVTDLIVKTNRAYSAARMAVRAQEAAVRVAGMSARGAELRDELAKMLDERDSLKYLLEALSVRRANLGRTSSDIRLMANIIEAERAPGRANAGPERKPPPPPLEPEPRLGPAQIPTPAEFEKGMAEIMEKAQVITDPAELLAPKSDPDLVLKPTAKTPTTPDPAAKGKAPAAPEIADGDEIDMEAFLES